MSPTTRRSIRHPQPPPIFPDDTRSPLCSRKVGFCLLAGPLGGELYRHQSDQRRLAQSCQKPDAVFAWPRPEAVGASSARTHIRAFETDGEFGVTSAGMLRLDSLDRERRLTINDTAEVLGRLLTPTHLYSREEVLKRPTPVDMAPGIYGWYFDELPPGVNRHHCHTVGDSVLLYMGIAPKEPPQNGSRPSAQTLPDRIRYHYRGNASGSTLRLTLGCHLSGRLDIALRRVGSGNRLTFTPDGERKVSDWMHRHARVTWTQTAAPWFAETQAMKQLSLPLNLQGNSHHPHYATLKALRAAHRTAARALPIA